VTAGFNHCPSPLAVLYSPFFPFFLSSIKVPSGEKKRSHRRAGVLFAAIALLSCLVRAFSSAPQICPQCLVTVISQLPSSAAAQSCTPQPRAVTLHSLAAPGQWCSLVPRLVPHAALGFGPCTMALSLMATRPAAQGSFGALHTGPITAPSCHPQMLLETAAAVIGVGGLIRRSGNNLAVQCILISRCSFLRRRAHGGSLLRTRVPNTLPFQAKYNCNMHINHFPRRSILDIFKLSFTQVYYSCWVVSGGLSSLVHLFG